MLGTNWQTFQCTGSKKRSRQLRNALRCRYNIRVTLLHWLNCGKKEVLQSRNYVASGRVNAVKFGKDCIINSQHIIIRIYIFLRSGMGEIPPHESIN
jgi:hypothetical protein